MRNRIVTTVLAISLLATVFCALPVKAELSYVGSSVKTTDSFNVPADKFFVSADASMHIFFNIELVVDGIHDDVPTVDVLLENTAGGVSTWINDITVTSADDPANPNDGPGWYVSSGVDVALSTAAVIVSGDVQAYYVVVYDEYSSGTGVKTREIARAPVLIMKQSLRLDPAPGMTNPYYPGEEISITLFTSKMGELFYVQIVNETWYAEENWTGHSAPSGSWSFVWTVRQNMPDGKYTLNVRNSTHKWLYGVTAGVDGFDMKELWVNKYTLQVDSDRTHYMPGETANITYRTVETATGIPYSGTSITFTAIWLTKTVWYVDGTDYANHTWLNGTLTGSSGTQEFVVPADVNTTEDIFITYWANETGRSATDNIQLVMSKLVGTLTIPDNSAYPGEIMQVEAWAGVAGDDGVKENLPGAAIEITVKWNGTAIGAYASSNLTTDRAGGATHTFALSAAASLGTYVVGAKITMAGNSITLMNSFSVTSVANFWVVLDRDAYVSGESATVSFRAALNNEEIAVASISYDATIAGDIIASGNSTGEDVSVAIPEDARGTLTVTAKTNIKGQFKSNFDTATIYAARIALTPSESNYRPGETITWQWQLVTSLTSAMLRYEVYDSFSVRVAQGDLAFALAGELEYSVPADDTSTSYKAVVVLQTETGVYLKSDSTVNRLTSSGYEISIWVGKSGYASGEFKPGSSITVHYAIKVLNGVELPVYRLHLSADWDNIGLRVLVEDETGEIEYEIAEDAPLGSTWVYANLYDGLTGASLASDNTRVWTNNRLSGWDKSVGGMAASDFTILVLIIIMILLLIVMPFLKARMGAPKPAKVEPPPPTPPQ